MNKAADNIDAKSRSLKDIFFEKHYKVGYFQREYKWHRSHIEDLIIDLERSFNSNWEKGHTQKDVANYSKYYMGPIVIFEDNSEFSIVDGQQRLTSFILLMIFLNREYNSILNIRDKYIGYIYSEHYGTESYNMNIPERDVMLNFLHKGGEFDESILNNESCKTILERYNDITELFPPSLLIKDIYPLFTNWLTEKLVFIEILTQTSESAYTIFETMNDRGLNLTQTELLKSYLLSNVKDDIKIMELDTIWKNKISALNSVDDDQDFFKAWLRAKFAVSVRTSEKDSENRDFEKIGTRFSSWTQENTKIKENGDSKILLDIRDSGSFYFFVKSDFSFFSDLYIKLCNFLISNTKPDHRFKLMYYRGISPSLSYPLILSPILKIDDEITIANKVDLVIKYIDSLGAYKMLLGEPITHSSIISKLGVEISEYRKRFLNEDYTRLDSNSKYILARLYIHDNPGMDFENVYFQRRKDSFVQYQFLKSTDFETDKIGMPKGLKDRLVYHLCSFTMVPKGYTRDLDGMDVVQRIQFLQKKYLLLDSNDSLPKDLNNLKEFFIKREKSLKEKILNLWKLN